MEKAIIIKSVFCGWISLMVGLCVFSFVYSVAMQQIDLISAIPICMAAVSLFVFFAEKRILTKELTKPESEDDEE